MPGKGFTTRNSVPWVRLDGVDALRGIAIFFVLMNHVNMRLHGAQIPYTDGVPDQLVTSLVWNGQRGVQIFFAVSGFLITSTALRRWGNLSNLRIVDFYRLRFARIAPLLILLLVVLSALHYAGIRNFVVSQETGGLSRALVAALTFHVNVLEASRGYLPANWDILWSLSVEEVFYIAFPLVCALLGRSWTLIALLTTLVAIGPVARTVLAQGNNVWREYSYLGGMDAIALGCLTAIFASERQIRRKTLCNLGVGGMLVVLACLCWSIRLDALGLKASGLDMTLLAAGTCMVILYAAQTQWRSPGLLTPLMTLGRLSYEIYLTHMFVVFALFNVFVDLGKPLIGVLPLFLGVILVSAALGFALERWYTEPLNRWLRKRVAVPKATPSVSDSNVYK